MCLQDFLDLSCEHDPTLDRAEQYALMDAGRLVPAEAPEPEAPELALEVAA